MEFKQLEAFVAVVEYNSFSEAAKHLYLTQPTISSHIRSLEQELNSKLILRTTKKLTVTARGQQLYDCAVNMLNMRNTLVDEFTSSDKKIIDLGVSTIPSSYLLPELLGTFSRQLPNIYFHAWQSDSQGVILRVLDGSIDLGLVGSQSEEKDCQFIPFCHDKLVLATPVTPYFLKMQEQGAQLTDFLDQPFIMREKGSGTKKELDRYLEDQGISQSSLNIVARMNDLEAVRRSIVQGIGISVLSYRSAKDLADSRQMLLFPLDKGSSVRTFYIVYNKNRILKNHVKQFIHFTESFYQNPEKL